MAVARLREVVQLNGALISLGQGLYTKDEKKVWVNCSVRDWPGSVEHCVLLPEAAFKVFGVRSETEFREKAASGDMQIPSTTWNLRGVVCCT